MLEKYNIPIYYVSKIKDDYNLYIYDDIDFEHHTVHVDKALGKTEYGGYEIKSPKSHAGYREIDIPDRLMNVIKEKIEDGKPRFHRGEKGFFECQVVERVRVGCHKNPCPVDHASHL